VFGDRLGEETDFGVELGRIEVFVSVRGLVPLLYRICVDLPFLGYFFSGALNTLVICPVPACLLLRVVMRLGDSFSLWGYFVVMGADFCLGGCITAQVWVLEDVRQRDTRRWGWLGHVFDKINEVGVVIVYLALLHIANRIRLQLFVPCITSLTKSEAGGTHDEQDRAKGKDISSRSIVFFTGTDFGSHVVDRSAVGGQLFAIRSFKHFIETEICDLWHRVLVEENVLKLEVSVRYSMFMDMLYTCADLAKNLS